MDTEPAGSYQKGYELGRHQGTKHRISDILQISAQRDELLYLLQQVRNDLPQNRDWLDPVIEKRIDAALAKHVRDL